MALITIVLMGVALTLFYKFYIYSYKYWEYRGVPFERPLPLIGNMKGIGTKYHFRDINQRLYDRFKGTTPFCGMYVFLQRVAMIVDLDLVKQVLIKDFGVFHDRGIYNNVRDEPLTGHLLTLEGEEWRSMRHKLTPVFTSGKMKHMFGVVVEVGQHLANTMDNLVGNDGVQIKEICARFTTDVIGTCAFGLNCNSLADPNAEFRVKGRMILEKPRHHPLVQAFIITNPKLAKKFRFKLFPDEVTEFFLEAIRNTVDYRLKNGIKRNDFLDQLIELRSENHESIRQREGIDLSEGLTIEQMAAQAFVFFLAGFETSSSTMSFCLYELALHQDIQDKLREEIKTALNEVSQGEITHDAIGQMTYLDQVLSETLRKYAIVAQLIRMANQDFKVPNSELVIEKGTTVIIPVHNIHHDPDIYPDPQRFDPTRFESDAIENRHKYAYLPFGDGPRNCIGERFGKMQTKIGLISLLRHFRFGVSNQTEIPLILNMKSFPLSTKNGIHLKVERISS